MSHNGNRNEIRRAATCPYCDGPIERELLGDICGRRELWLHCAGLCGRYFAPPWREKDWCEPDSEPVPRELVSRYCLAPTGDRG